MAGKKILIIHSLNQAKRNIHEVLSRFDFDIIYANDGLQGLKTMQMHKPDLIVSQINLAYISGLELIKILRQDSSLSHIPFICLHNELDLMMIKKAKAHGAKAFLIKPYIDNSLIYAIKSALSEMELKINLIKEPVAYEKCETPVQPDYRYNIA